ncbi:MAG: IS66 family insertion sequence element accessory protein TnpB [Bacteroidetes bacterium]|nr:IS66 family insertion sequence element accessory protein TnpB [Bacteroidota bacterium]
MRLQEQMYQLVASYEQNGQSQKEFCSQQGIGLAKLNYWIRKYRQQQQPSAGFLKIETIPASSQQHLEICYPNGVKLTLSGADLSLISQLIRLY